MTTAALAVHFANPDLAQFVQTITTDLDAKDETEHVVLARDELEMQLLDRLNNGKSSVLRYRNTNHWMITGFEARDLLQTVARLQRLLSPSYGLLSQHSANMEQFEPAKGELHALAQQLSLVGFYRLEIDAKYLPQVRRAIQNWIRLEDQRPFALEAPRPTYRELLSAFRTALATASWTEAEQVVEEISRSRLTSADNVVFLTVQLLANREQWFTIWSDSRYGEWSRQRIPRAVRTALIQSFHHSVLLPRELEGDWSAALEEFRRERPRLGNLLGARLQENALPVASVFAYFAVDSSDHALATGLRKTLPDEVLQGIAPILDLLPPVQSSSQAPPVGMEVQAAVALLEGNLDLARVSAKEIADPTIRMVLFVDLANRSRDLVDVELALTAMADLPSWRLAELYIARPYLKSQIEELEAQFYVTSESGQTSKEIAPLTWTNWLAALIENGMQPGLDATLDSLIAKSDERLWEPAEARVIGDHVLAVITGAHNAPAQVANRAIDALTESLLIDDAFPRKGIAYTDLYEAVYTFLLEESVTNDGNSKKLLRLAEGILIEDPSRVQDIHQHFRHWFATPRVVLIDRMMERLELVADYGIEGSALVPDFRLWADALLASPSEIEATTIRAWASFASAIHADDDIVSRLRAYGATHKSSLENLVVNLPKKFRIAIFTLRPKSAARVKDILLAINPTIDVQITDEKDLSSHVQQLASSADLPVVVTSCITHALTYGIDPFLRVAPARPESSGSTSILRSIEKAIESLK